MAVLLAALHSGDSHVCIYYLLKGYNSSSLEKPLLSDTSTNGDVTSSAGAKVNDYGRGNNTPLHFAARNNHIPAVSFLLGERAVT